MTLWDIILSSLVAALVVCPPRYDPAIWMSEWTARRDKRTPPHGDEQ